MKRLIAGLIALSFSAALMGQAVVVKHKAATCSTAKDSTLTLSPATNTLLLYDSTLAYIALPFTAGSSYTLCALDVALRKVGSPVFNVAAAIYTNSGPAPGALVGTASTPIAASTATGSYAAVHFSGLSASIVSGTSYYIVVYYTSGTTGYFANYLDLGVASGVSSDYVYISPAAISWTQGSAYYKSDFKAYSN